MFKKRKNGIATNDYTVISERVALVPSTSLYEGDEVGSTFEIGKAAKVRDGKDVTIFATGICVAEAVKAAELLEKEEISAAVSNMFTIKPVDKEAVVEVAQKTGAIVTAENHNIVNGLGSAVAEVLCENTCVPLERVGAKDIFFGEVGDVGYLKERFKMTAEDIAASAKKAISRK